MNPLNYTYSGVSFYGLGSNIVTSVPNNFFSTFNKIYIVGSVKFLNSLCSPIYEDSINILHALWRSSMYSASTFKFLKVYTFFLTFSKIYYVDDIIEYFAESNKIHIRIRLQCFFYLLPITLRNQKIKGYVLDISWINQFLWCLYHLMGTWLLFYYVM